MDKIERYLKMQQEQHKIEWVSAQKAGVIFDVKTPTIRSWIRKGIFPNAVRHGDSHWRIPMSDIEAFIKTKVG